MRDSNTTKEGKKMEENEYAGTRTNNKFRRIIRILHVIMDWDNEQLLFAQK